MGNGILRGLRASTRGTSRRTLLAALLTLLTVPATAGAGGITNGGSDLRDGWYGNQPDLSPDLVSGGTFGQLWNQPVDGQVYAQPLVHNGRVIVATERNHVYSFNAETGQPVWDKAMPGAPQQAADVSCTDLQPDVGITATPVIDPDTGTIYLTHKRYDSGTSGPASYWLDALDPTTGDQRAGFPVKFAGPADNYPDVSFNGNYQLQRPGLLLLDGVVYAGFGSMCDMGSFKGWVIGISTAGVTKARWVAQKSDGAGIWQSGSGLMSDGAGRIFIATGNQGAPWYDPSKDGSVMNDTMAESVIRLQVGADGKLTGKDWFSPYDSYKLDTWDADFASGGVTALRDDVFGTATVPHLALAVGKAGYLYLLNRDRLGGINNKSPDGGDDVVQRLGPDGGVWSRPAVWPGDGGYIFLPTASGANSGTPYGSEGNLHVYSYGETASGSPRLSHVGQSNDGFGFGSSAPVITSDATTSGTGVLWTVWMAANSGGWNAQLRAYDAVPDAQGKPRLLASWPVGQAAKFNPPGVGDGRIYVGTKEGRIRAFGAPVVTRVTGGSTTFPRTTVGQSSTKNVTLVANGTVTVNGVSSSSSAFTVGGSTTYPHPMTAGGQLVVPVTFQPSQAGAAGGTLTVDTDQGPFQFTLTGTGQQDGPYLMSPSAVVSFGGVRVGQPRDDTVVLRNDGSQDVKIKSVELPGAPFVINPEDVPAPETVLTPGKAVTVPVRFAPSAVGLFADELAISTYAGPGVNVGLTGVAGNGPALSLDSSAVDFGDVVVGQTAVKEVKVTNTGDLPLQIMLSKPPVSGPIVAVDRLDEGATLAAGATRTLRVQFTPEAAGVVTATWPITGNDDSGQHDVHVAGNGVPAPVATPPGGPTPPGGGTTPPGGGTTPPPPGTKAAARLKLRGVKVAKNRKTITITGTLTKAATGRVKATLGARVKRKTIKATKSVKPKAGRFTITLTMPKALRRLRRASLRVSFAGDAKVKAQSLRAVTVKIRR